MDSATERQMLIDSILAKCDKLQKIREEKAKQGVTPVQLSKEDNP